MATDKKPKGETPKGEKPKGQKPEDAGFIGRVVDDPANPPQARLLTGWLGASAEEGYRRLYTDAELSTYVELPEDAILDTEPIRDMQPSGGVFVWIKRDAAVKQGGSAASRAARFLQGRVAQDFSSPEKAGYRCATQTPGCEPTGFTGQCTNQPEVGGAWPCITALPFCAVPTGFTGKCTHQPWPNPTQYAGCTVLHCPTYDLTQQPHVCRIVESAMPGCGGEEPKAAAAEGGGEGDAAARPVTALPGCGYTETWGLCETQIPGCGFAKQAGPQCPPDTNIPGCGWSRNPICTDLPGCGWTQQWGLCQPSVQNPCIPPTETPDCGGQVGARLAGGGGTFTRFGACVTADCTIAGEPCVTLSAGGACRTEFGPRCPNTRPPRCPLPSVTMFVCCDPPTFNQPRCPTYPNGDCTFFGCLTQPPKCQISVDVPCITRDLACGTTRNPDVCIAAVGAAGAPGGGANAAITALGCPSAIDACPSMRGCQTQPPTALCTPAPQLCATHCGPGCQTPQPGCTSINCTHAGPQCPEPTIGVACTAVPPQCPRETNVQLDCTFGCTQFGPACPATPPLQCAQTTGPNCAQVGAAAAPRGDVHMTLLTIPVWACWPTPATRCFICPAPRPSPLPWFCPPSPWCPPVSLGIACTVLQCWPGGGGGGTAATVCTQAGQQCRSAVDACPTRLCGGGGGAQFAAPAGATDWQGCTQSVQQCLTVVGPPCFPG